MVAVTVFGGALGLLYPRLHAGAGVGDGQQLARQAVGCLVRGPHRFLRHPGDHFDLGRDLFVDGALHRLLAGVGNRSEERRVGKECGSTCRSRWSPFHSTHNVLRPTAKISIRSLTSISLLSLTYI